MMSGDNGNVSEQARQLVAASVDRLRALIVSAQKELAERSEQVRQIERRLDETTTQYHFAAQSGASNSLSLGQREQQLRAEHATIVQHIQTSQHRIRQIEQLVRQIEMSSATLQEQADAPQSDPWALALRAQVIHGREEERSRLAREVHDGPAQVVANNVMGLEQCIMLARDGRHDILPSMLERLRDMSREGLREMRMFISHLRPGVLTEDGLVAAIEEHARRYHESYGVTISVEAQPIPRLAGDTEIVLYRIVQEALQNIHKHARTANVTIRVQQDHGDIHIAIRDDGPGFDPHEVARRAGRANWGLTSMRERAELVGARFGVASRPGYGTEVRVSVTVSSDSGASASRVGPATRM